MNNKLIGIIAFSLGAVAGSLVTWKVLKEKYEEVIEAEEIFSKRDNDKDIQCDKENNDKNDDETESFDDAVKIIKENEYVDKDEEVKNLNEPYVIAPEEYGEIEDYDLITLIYYDDGYLADEMDKVVDDIENTVGEDFHTHFGEYEEDTVFIRNDVRRVDYEIQRDYAKYKEIMEKYPMEE